jgi:hypothetical protein
MDLLPARYLTEGSRVEWLHNIGNIGGHRIMVEQARNYGISVLCFAWAPS